MCDCYSTKCEGCGDFICDECALVSQGAIECQCGNTWCDKCEDYRLPILYKWESSKAVIYDYECEKCGEILTRIPRQIVKKEGNLGGNTQ